tara:strand:- start:288 stop:710 length:423 start_codon:yes stop_codon:yes gene_type:complete
LAHPGAPADAEGHPEADAQSLVRAIEGEGFVGTASAEDMPAPVGFPFRWPFLIAVIAVIAAWQLAFLADALRTGRGIPGPGADLPFTAIFALSIAIRFPGPLQRVALRGPRALLQVRQLLTPLALVTGLFSALALLRFLL